MTTGDMIHVRNKGLNSRKIRKNSRSSLTSLAVLAPLLTYLAEPNSAKASNRMPTPEITNTTGVLNAALQKIVCQRR